MFSLIHKISQFQLKIISQTVEDPGFPRGDQPRAYIVFEQKLHKIGRFLPRGPGDLTLTVTG